MPRVFREIIFTEIIFRFRRNELEALYVVISSFYIVIISFSIRFLRFVQHIIRKHTCLRWLGFEFGRIQFLGLLLSCHFEALPCLSLILSYWKKKKNKSSSIAWHSIIKLQKRCWFQVTTIHKEFQYLLDFGGISNVWNVSF